MRAVLKLHFGALHGEVTIPVLVTLRITKSRVRGGHDISHFVLLPVAPVVSRFASSVGTLDLG